jgi:hypothetical protein
MLRGLQSAGASFVFGAKGGADPLVRAGRARPALPSKNQLLAIAKRPTWGSAADVGVRPTIYED